MKTIKSTKLKINDGQPINYEELNNIKFGNRLKFARVSAGLSQEELASLLNSRQNAIGAYETGKFLPNEGTIHLMADKLKVDYAWLRYGLGTYTIKDLENASGKEYKFVTVDKASNLLDDYTTVEKYDKLSAFGKKAVDEITNAIFLDENHKLLKNVLDEYYISVETEGRKVLHEAESKKPSKSLTLVKRLFRLKKEDPDLYSKLAIDDMSNSYIEKMLKVQTIKEKNPKLYNKYSSTLNPGNIDDLLDKAKK